MRVIGMGVLVVSLAIGCSSPDAPEAGGAPQPAAAPRAKAQPASAGDGALTIGVVRTRDAQLRISAGKAGPRFAVMDAAGRTLAEDLDAAELSRAHPELYRTYRSARAQGPAIDARLDPEHRAAPAGQDTPQLDPTQPYPEPSRR